jgi:uncharacterized protein with FMN-binding domain
MKRLVLLVSGTAVAIAVAVAIRPHPRPAPHNSAAGSATPTARTSSPLPSATRHVYHSGTVTGRVAHTDYGGVQVRVTVAHGRIVRVTALRLPHGNQMDVRLSKPAARTLEREVISTQGAEVDMVSGASYTSRGYLRSLQSALDRLS